MTESHTRTIYVALLNEERRAWRPVHAARRANDVYLIVSTNDDPESEVWEFQPGTLVRCERRTLSEGERLVAVERALPVTPKLVRS
ncbi:MAG: hypothetical protein QM718_09280 [Steroidobacteraceae bacterium]